MIRRTLGGLLERVAEAATVVEVEIPPRRELVSARRAPEPDRAAEGTRRPVQQPAEIVTRGESQRQALIDSLASPAGARQAFLMGEVFRRPAAGRGRRRSTARN